MDAKLDLPLYNGKIDLEATMDWVDAPNSLFDCDDILENQSVKIAMSRLKGFSLTWWNLIQDDKMKNEKSPVTTWKKMLALLRETYVLEGYEG